MDLWDSRLPPLGVWVDSAFSAQWSFAKSLAVKHVAPAGGRLCGSVVAQTPRFA